MNAYVRFQTRLRCGETGRPAGIFLAAGIIRESKHTHPINRERVVECLSWFNKNLTIPAQDRYHWRCVFWFRSEACQIIDHIWDLAAVLQDEGVYTRKIWTAEPGKILYRDRHQIAAIPPPRSAALRVDG